MDPQAMNPSRVRKQTEEELEKTRIEQEKLREEHEEEVRRAAAIVELEDSGMDGVSVLKEWIRGEIDHINATPPTAYMRQELDAKGQPVRRVVAGDEVAYEAGIAQALHMFDRFFDDCRSLVEREAEKKEAERAKEEKKKNS